MTNYDIHGIGAALVDTEVRVSEKFLRTEGISKGVMTLVDEKRQHEILNALAFEQSSFARKCGGSVCNSIFAAGCLGAKTFFSGKVADDADGKFFAEDLLASGIDFHSAQREPGVTGKCLVLVTDDAERTLNTFLGVSDGLSVNEIDDVALLNSRWLYIEGYLMTDEARTKMTRVVIEEAKRRGVKVAISLSDPFVVEMYADNLRHVIGLGVDLIFCNKSEAIAYTGTTNIEDIADKLCKHTSSFAMTDGANGSMCFDGRRLISTEGMCVHPVDTNGAGDMFAGAFLYAITLGRDFEWAAGFSNNCASRVVQQFGPRLDQKDFESIKNDFNL